MPFVDAASLHLNRIAGWFLAGFQEKPSKVSSLSHNELDTVNVMGENILPVNTVNTQPESDGTDTQPLLRKNSISVAELVRNTQKCADAFLTGGM
ncbi:hypothetical protein BASA84_000621 [Batrachochytrium salamandrivorans]|nr:hypothetical protein BASA84_000621 [Batrachochytrium salamandrivorans]